MIKIFSLKINEMVEHPGLLLGATTDVFDKPLGDDSLLRQLQASPMEESFQLALEAALSSVKTVVEDQLGRYISGELSNVTEDDLFKTQASSPHNVWAERVLGMYNAVHDRTKQAKPTHIETKCQLATN